MAKKVTGMTEELLATRWPNFATAEEYLKKAGTSPEKLEHILVMCAEGEGEGIRLIRKGAPQVYSFHSGATVPCSEDTAKMWTAKMAREWLCRMELRDQNGKVVYVVDRSPAGDGRIHGDGQEAIEGQPKKARKAPVTRQSNGTKAKREDNEIEKAVLALAIRKDGVLRTELKEKHGNGASINWKSLLDGLARRHGKTVATEKKDGVPLYRLI